MSSDWKQGFIELRVSSMPQAGQESCSRQRPLSAIKGTLLDLLLSSHSKALQTKADSPHPPHAQLSCLDGITSYET